MSLEQIGQKLKATREGQSLSLGQIYDRTKIPPNHLEAIESGIADDLPETVYVAGFIKRYGDLLGLNGQSLADEYKRGSQPVEAGRGMGSMPVAWPPSR
jgi:cytoskeleton protein RodZ